MNAQTMVPDEAPAAEERHRLELRVLAGIHAGARMALPAPGRAVTVGSRGDCDVLLRDVEVEGDHATIVVGSITWTWVPTASAAPATLTFGTVVNAAPVLLTVDEPHAPWPSGDALAVAVKPKVAPPAIDDLQVPPPVPQMVSQAAPARGRFPAWR